jgi:hypothetical protein
MAVQFATLGAQVGQTSKAIEDHEGRLRRVEERADLTAQLAALAVRVDALEELPRGVTPWQLWAAAGSAVAMAGVFVTIIDKLTH